MIFRRVERIYLESCSFQTVDLVVTVTFDMRIVESCPEQIRSLHGHIDSEGAPLDCG